MFKRKTETAFAGWPHTRLLEGKVGVHITGKYITPKLRDRVGLLTITLTIAIFFVYSSQNTEGTISMLGFFAIVALFIVPVPFYFWVKNVFSANLNIKIFPDMIEANHRQYTRSEPIEFRVERHHKATEEVAREQNTGQRTSSTFRQAIEVVMQYGEKRVVLAEMREKDLEMAKALVIRAQNICNQFDKAIAGMTDKETAPKESVGGDFGPEPNVR
jgi:hypothetical protein